MFFVKQKTAYEMRISDWSSDVCSSDLMEKDANGIQRMLLNDEFVFQYGPLDQGWWPDGLYTAPTDEALLFDIEKTQEMGFNMIQIGRASCRERVCQYV